MMIKVLIKAGFGTVVVPAFHNADHGDNDDYDSKSDEDGKSDDGKSENNSKSDDDFQKIATWPAFTGVCASLRFPLMLLLFAP